MKNLWSNSDKVSKKVLLLNASNKDIQLIAVSRQLGHTKASITLNLYCHLLPTMLAESAEKIDDLIIPVEVQQFKTGANL